jgi:hypothetical protein
VLLRRRLGRPCRRRRSRCSGSAPWDRRPPGGRPRRGLARSARESRYGGEAGRDQDLADPRRGFGAVRCAQDGKTPGRSVWIGLHIGGAAQPDRRHQVALRQHANTRASILSVLHASGARPLTFCASATSTSQPSSSSVSCTNRAPFIDSITARTRPALTRATRMAQAVRIRRGRDLRDQLASSRRRLSGRGHLDPIQRAT